MIEKRILESVAMFIIGDSVLCVVSPRRHTTLWLSGPRWWRRAWGPLVERPMLVRALGVAGLAIGICWAWQQEEIDPHASSTARLAPTRLATWIASAVR